MKRLFIVILFFVFIFGAKSFSINSDSYSLRSLYFFNLSTNNILDYFSDITVVRIYPYINPIYNDRVGDISYRVSGDLGSEISLFFIKKNSYLDYNYLYMNGISIDRLDVYISDVDLDNLYKSDLIFYVK